METSKLPNSDTLQTSTPKAPSRHREFFEKLYGSLETNQKLDSSSSSEEGVENKRDDSSTGSPTEKIDGKSSPLRPFPSFPVPTSALHEQNRFLPGSGNIGGSSGSAFPYLPHHFGSNSAESAAAASMEAALRLPDFPFPGGLAAFCK